MENDSPTALSAARSWLELDLSAVKENLRRLRAHCAACGNSVLVMPAVKANAYNHGAVAVARAAVEAGCERLAIATVAEGEELRRAGIGVPLQLLGAVLPDEIPAAVACDLIFSVHEVASAERLNAEATRQRKRGTVHLKIDSGMGRLGVLPDAAVATAVAISRLPALFLEGAFMHFAVAAAAEYSRRQIVIFDETLAAIAAAGVKIPLRHAANSTAIFRYPEAHYEMIRPGAAVYGFYDDESLREKFPLTPVLSWRCRVAQIKDYPAGVSLGYGRTAFTSRQTKKIAVLPVGYADGYARYYSNRADVLIGGRRAPVVGRVSMDYTLVDITDLPPLTVGAVATLIGADGTERITLEELARHHHDMIPYCVATAIGARVGRRVESAELRVES
ncbi:alanine racemase [Planctomycetales bacterium]|nr:alanine racemase [Planctomycetales bacterium]